MFATAISQLVPQIHGKSKTPQRIKMTGNNLTNSDSTGQKSLHSVTPHHCHSFVLFCSHTCVWLTEHISNSHCSGCRFHFFFFFLLFFCFLNLSTFFMCVSYALRSLIRFFGWMAKQNTHNTKQRRRRRKIFFLVLLMPDEAGKNLIFLETTRRWNWKPRKRKKARNWHLIALERSSGTSNILRSWKMNEFALKWHWKPLERVKPPQNLLESLVKGKIYVKMALKDVERCQLVPH